MWLKRVALLLTMTLAAIPARSEEVLRIGTEGAFPPFNMEDENGRIQGFDMDIAMALCAEAKLKCSVIKQDWASMIPALQGKKFDAVFASMSITEDRLRQVAFTEPYYSIKLQFVAARNSSFSAGQLKGRVLGALRGGAAETWLQAHAADADIRLYNNREAAYLDLAAGTLDAVLADQFMQYRWLQSSAGMTFAFKGPPVAVTDRIGVALRKEDTALQARLNAALKVITTNGVYQKINDRYFPFGLF